ncbi:MAG: class I SAM-dependent methyltransferase [bacterium]
MDWPVRLFNKSVHKQRKWKEILSYLGDTEGLNCLDIGSDNGVISLLLRRRGGNWKSADLDINSVSSIRSLVNTDVFQIDGSRTPFKDDEFDRIVIVDFLEHIPDDSSFVEELFRIMKPNAELIINVPHLKLNLLRRFRYLLGQTDEKHGHLRPGYTVDQLSKLLDKRFTILSHRSYSRFFSEVIDTVITFGYGLLQGKPKQAAANEKTKGVLITEAEMKKYRKVFLLYSFLYPFVWLFVKLDALLFFRTGYLLIVKARINKSVHANAGVLEI